MLALRRALGFFLRALSRLLLTVIRAASCFSRDPSTPPPPPRDPLLLTPASVLAERIRRGELKSSVVVQAFISRIREVNPVLNAVVFDRFEEALCEARAVDDLVASKAEDEATIKEKYPLLGVPLTVKEAFALQGMPQSSGLISRQSLRSTTDAAVVSRLKAAGAIPLCVTNCSELCMWYESSNNVYGKTRNPYNPQHIVGGSSGGEGCILGAAGSVIGVGSDIGGSIRMPAFFNGIYGHKPTPDAHPVLHIVGESDDLAIPGQEGGHIISAHIRVEQMHHQGHILLPVQQGKMKAVQLPVVIISPLEGRIDVQALSQGDEGDGVNSPSLLVLEAQDVIVLEAEIAKQDFLSYKAKRLLLPVFLSNLHTYGVPHPWLPLRKSEGIVPNDGQFPNAHGCRVELLCTGPMCRYAADLPLVLKVMGGKDAEKLSLDQEVSLRSLRFFTMEHDGGCLFVSPVDKELVQAQRRVAQHLETSLGVRVQPISIHNMRYSFQIWSAVMSSDADKDESFTALLANGGRLWPSWEFVKWLFGLSKHTIPAIGLAFAENLTNLNPQGSAKMVQKGKDLKEELNTMLGEDGVLIYPSHPKVAPKHHQPLALPFNFAYTGILNVLGLPVTQCPLGLSQDGLPLGVQIVSSKHNDRLTLAVAQHLEKAFGGWTPPGPV